MTGNPPAREDECSTVDDVSWTEWEIPLVSVRARLKAWLMPGRLDRLLAVGAPAPAGSALALHAARITSASERNALADSLGFALEMLHSGRPTPHPRIPVHRHNIAAVEALIETIASRLRSRRTVGVRGVARLRAVLSDGCGPFYDGGKGDLEGRLGAVLAAL
jgi:hypothetical protein